MYSNKNCAILGIDILEVGYRKSGKMVQFYICKFILFVLFYFIFLVIINIL